MSTHPDPWAHDPDFCGTLDCPGCYASMYVPLDQRTPAEFSVYLFNAGRMEEEPYTNGDREEDTEAGVSRRDAKRGRSIVPRGPRQSPKGREVGNYA